MSGAPAASSLVEVEGLCVAFGARRVVRDVSFRLARGATLALVGESGSGKSLSALSLLGLLPAGAAATGRVRIAGEDVIGAASLHAHAALGRAPRGTGAAFAGRAGADARR